MLNVEIFRNRIAAQGGDTVLNNSKGTLEVYNGLESYEYDLDFASGTWFINETAIPHEIAD